MDSMALMEWPSWIEFISDVLLAYDIYGAILETDSGRISITLHDPHSTTNQTGQWKVPYHYPSEMIQMESLTSSMGSVPYSMATPHMSPMPNHISRLASSDSEIQFDLGESDHRHDFKSTLGSIIPIDINQSCSQAFRFKGISARKPA